MVMKASALAHPVQGLIKTRGSMANELRMSFHDSISVCTAPLKTQTTIEFGEFENDMANVEGQEVWGEDLERIIDLVNAIRFEAQSSLRFRAISTSDFPREVGEGSSASVFASMALAACKALDLDLNLQKVSKLAAKGNISSAMAVTGGFSRLKMRLGDQNIYSYQVASEELQMGMLVSAAPLFKPSEGMRMPGLQLPPRPSRVAEVAKPIEEMELAIRERDVGKVFLLAEKDAHALHGVQMTGVGEELVWPPETLRLIRAVKKMRDDGIPAFFTVGNEGAVYINTFLDRIDEVEARIRDLGAHYWKCKVGGEARIVDDNLF